MQIFDKGKIYNFMGMRWIMFIISAILFFGSIGLLFTKGLSYGIDFAGGTLIPFPIFNQNILKQMLLTKRENKIEKIW